MLKTLNWVNLNKYLLLHSIFLHTFETQLVYIKKIFFLYIKYFIIIIVLKVKCKCKYYETVLRKYFYKKILKFIEVYSYIKKFVFYCKFSLVI